MTWLTTTWLTTLLTLALLAGLLRALMGGRPLPGRGALAAALALALLLTGCAAQEGSESPAPSESSAPSESPAPSESSAPSESPAPSEEGSAQPPAPAEIAAGFAGEELLSRPEDFDQFIADEDPEFQSMVVFTVDAAVTQFQFNAIEYDERAEAEGLEFSVTEVLYTQEELTPQRPLVIGMVFVGAVPNRGISYVDTDGTQRQFSLSISGKDGSLLLVEYNVEE